MKKIEGKVLFMDQNSEQLVTESKKDKIFKAFVAIMGALAIALLIYLVFFCKLF